jgi:hypothetical protein
MAVDPNHSPIFGDYVPSNPPRPVQVAHLLLLGNVVVEIGYRALLAENFNDGVLPFTLFMLMLLGFAFGARAGMEWARLGAAAWAFTSVVFAVGTVFVERTVQARPTFAAGSPTGLALTTTSVALLVVAIVLLYRPLSTEYFRSRSPQDT